MSNSILEMLTFNDFEEMIYTDQTVERGKIITKHLKKDLLIFKNILYQLKPNVIYEQHETNGNFDNSITNIISIYVNNSFNALSKMEKENLKLKSGKMFKKIFENSWIKTFLPQIQYELTNNNIEFDFYENKIHFLNGYMDLKDNKFKSRNVEEDFITKYINREYIPSTEEQQKKVMMHINKIYKNKDDRECILRIIARSIAGLSSNSQVNTFLLGLGSSGKSTVMKLCKESFTCYYKELDSNAFSDNNNKKDKIMNTYAFDPQIRITCINEMKDEKMNSSLFKSFIEGSVETTMLFKEKSHTINHQSALIFLSNTMPNLPQDTGTSRRMEVCEHKSLFVMDEKLVNETKNVFLGDKFLIENIIKKGLLNAWCDIILTRSNKLIIDKSFKVEYSENFKESKDLVIESDNPFLDFINKKIIVEEGNEDLKISKDNMLEEYKEHSKNQYIKNSSLITGLKNNGLIYDSSKLRVNGEKGVWKYCRFNEIESNYVDEIDYKKLYEDLKKENELLKKENESLKLKKEEENFESDGDDKEKIGYYSSDDLDDDEEEILDNVEIEEIQHDLIVDYDKNELDDFLNKF